MLRKDGKLYIRTQALPIYQECFIELRCEACVELLVEDVEMNSN